MLRFLLLLLPAGPALAHPSERGLVMLLPTGLYMFGGAAAVALSFAVVALLPSPAFSRLTAKAAPAPVSRRRSLLASALSAVFLALVVTAGYLGSRDPLANPLPLTVWTLWWVGFTLLVVIFGDLWAVLNPWRLFPGNGWLRYPDALGYWPAVVLLLAFAWFELVDPAPQDPARLATAVLLYAAITLAAMALFGHAWLERGEAFSVFFRTVGRLSPWRGNLLHAGALPWSGVVFILVMLGTVSFDGLSRTFWWIDLAGENPLEYPGRSAMIGVNTLGLLATVAAIGLLYAAAVRLGGQKDYGAYIIAIEPIALGDHLEH